MDVPLYFYIAYNDMDRLSPGSDRTTLSAIEKIDIDLDGELNILDIACGVGSSTMLLADCFKNSTVEAIDMFKHYLGVLDERIAQQDLASRVFSYQMDMMDLDFANEEFDIVFCEASIEIIGFKRGLAEWKRLLKPNGYMIVSDVSWIDRPSSESVRFWKSIYGEVATIENKIAVIESEGYEFIDYVVVPKGDWDDYYNELEKNLNSLSSDKSAKDFVRQIKKEINHYRKHSDDYSYVFYIMKKI